MCHQLGVLLLPPVNRQIHKYLSKVMTADQQNTVHGLTSCCQFQCHCWSVSKRIFCPAPFSYLYNNGSVLTKAGQMSRQRFLHLYISKSRPATCCLEERSLIQAAGSKITLLNLNRQCHVEGELSLIEKSLMKLDQISVSMPGNICHLPGQIFSPCQMPLFCLHQFPLRFTQQLSLVDKGL